MNILVTGASSQIGKFLLSNLQGHMCLCISRNEQVDTENIHWVKEDLKGDMTSVWELCKADVWIHLGFLTLASPHFQAAAKIGIKRFIGFSSTSIFTKKSSGSEDEAQVIQQLIKAEVGVEKNCKGLGIRWTLFRPTMVYGCSMDKNITFIKKIIKRLGFFPVAGDGRGLRQPVHAEDLAKACVAALSHEAAMDKVYNLSGGEVLSYQDMVKKVFLSLNRQPRVLRVPVPIYKFMIVCLKYFSPQFAFVQSSMVDRMNMDMIFEHEEAIEDFGYNPRVFEP